MLKNIILHEKQGYLISDRADRKYFSDIDVAEGFLLLAPNSSAYFADSRYYSALVKKLEGTPYKPVLYKGVSSIKEYLKSKKIKTLFVDYRFTTLKEYEAYKSLKVKLKDGSNFLEKARSVKTNEEYENIKKACEITQKAYYLTIQKAKLGITEKELATIMKNNMLVLGGEEESFETIVAFGSNSAVPHHQTGDTPLSENMPILIDTGCKVNGYCSELTRTAFFGKPTEKFINTYNAVLRANLNAEAGIEEGMSFVDGDKIARETLKENGLDAFFTHSLGHGVGLNVHEYPTVSPKGKEHRRYPRNNRGHDIPRNHSRNLIIRTENIGERGIHQKIHKGGQYSEYKIIYYFLIFKV
jgi:Xaa-Pro aminopeptidase